MTQSTGIIKASLVQKAIEEREESLTAQAQDARKGEPKVSCHESKSSKARAEHEQCMHNLHRLVAEFKEWSEEAEHLLLKSKLEIERLKQGCKDSFDAGRAAGRLEMAGSEEYRAATVMPGCRGPEPPSMRRLASKSVYRKYSSSAASRRDSTSGCSTPPTGTSNRAMQPETMIQNLALWERGEGSRGEAVKRVDHVK